MTRISLISYLQLICFSIKATSDGPIVGYNYMGCFQSNEKRSITMMATSKDNMTIEICQQLCRDSTFSGLQAGDSCICNDDVGESLPESNCRKDCSGNKLQFCGGETGSGVSVYAVCGIGYYGPHCNMVCHCASQAPCNRISGNCRTGCETGWKGPSCDIVDVSNETLDRYVGCFRDHKIMALPNKNPDGSTGAGSRKNSIEICIAICSKYNYTYIGLQYGFDCNCGEHYDKYGISDECGKQRYFSCSGDPNQTCGGEYANSVFSVCPKGSYARNCVSKCHCRNDTRCTYANGSCPMGCETGWTGPNCNIRDCKVADGGCDGVLEFCEAFDLKFVEITRCGCKKGYSRKKPWENCTDINECTGNRSCLPGFNCSNTIGSYYCWYSPEGFVARSGTCENSLVSNENCTDAIAVGMGSAICTALLILIIQTIFYLIYRRRRQLKQSGLQQDVHNVNKRAVECSNLSHHCAQKENSGDGEGAYTAFAEASDEEKHDYMEISIRKK